ncbi:MAG: helix-turn-helix domain-containing protein [Lachnospiraceae bacterium]|nr:helix-turn-helix domain-containing protein [Lachnospiraceae bacterium]
MNFSEKLLTLRKANDLTQEQLAEKLDVSRQSVSKWESAQATPELEKIVALSTVFNVTTDYLLKSSEIDDLSVKTEMLEKQQQLMLIRERKKQRNFECAMYALAIYLVFFAVYFIGHYYFEIWNASVIFSEFLIATAIAICVCVKKLNQDRQP